MNLQQYTTNDLSDFDFATNYSVMIGINPSKGAKSPKLWNHVLKDNSKMICLDIPNVEKLKKAFTVLENDKFCLGGAITAPYKTNVYEMCKFKCAIAEKTLSTNNIYKNDDGNFKADNTDGIGFIKSLKEEINISNLKNFLILGNGGVGRLVSSSLRDKIKEDQMIYTLTRTLDKKGIDDTNDVLSYREMLLKLSHISNLPTIMINCTSVGDYTNPDTSLIDEVPELKAIVKNLNIEFFFDCIHTPETTKLAKIFKNRVNGKKMNLYQAVHGFANVYKDYELIEISTKMQQYINDNI